MYSTFRFRKKIWRARTRRIFCPHAKKLLFLTFSWRVEVRARRARKCARTRNFFIIQKYHKKSLCNFFLLLISQKLKILAQFEVWTKSWKNPNFWQKSKKNGEKWWKSRKFHFFFLIQKRYYFVNFNDTNALKVCNRFKNWWSFWFWKNFWRARTCARAPLEYSVSMPKMGFSWHF